jgi:hypothetical protein
MADELSGARIKSISVAGWEGPDGEWRNVEAGDPAPSETQVADSSRVVIVAVDKDGERHYRTTSHLTADFGARDFIEAHYGVEFV